MKFGFVLATCFVVMFSVTAPSIAEAANYAAICKSVRLKSSERKECRARMKEAASEEERAMIFKEYDLRTIGLDINGEPLKK
tara:strand:+ start:2172 stop:2417 length:246 start_codon:yes stop_codon:yes gene_type:complete